MRARPRPSAALTAAMTPPVGRPVALLLLLGSGSAWLALMHSQAFAVFDPGNLAELCSALGGAVAPSFDRLWLAGRQMFFDGLLMVLAMMLPGAVRGSALTPACRAREPWPLHSAWMVAYLAAWCTGLLVAVLAAAAVSWLGWPGRTALPAGTPAQALALCAALMHCHRCQTHAVERMQRHHRQRAPPHALMHCHRLLAPAEVVLRAAPPRSTRAAWQAGLREGGRCMRRCALPMVALHALYGMSLAAMAAYAFWFWWRAGALAACGGGVGVPGQCSGGVSAQRGNA
jgi:hypothetical protein